MEKDNKHLLKSEIAYRIPLQRFHNRLLGIILKYSMRSECFKHEEKNKEIKKLLNDMEEFLNAESKH